MNGTRRVIIYVPGMKPKPPAEIHRANLWRCLLEGVDRVRPQLTEALRSQADCFRLVPWPHLFYPVPSDASVDEPGLERLLRLPGPEPLDLREAGHWKKQLTRLAYLVSDALPFLIDWVANPTLKATMTDSLRYLRNEANIAEQIRDLVADALLDAWRDGARILVIGHSMGSVVAWDTLWALSRRQHSDLRVDQFLTLGSPLGLNFMRHRLLGAREKGPLQYPDNIRRWVNLAAVGDLTALDRTFADDYREMLQLGLVESISDRGDLTNYFRGADGLNVHRCYGYMINPHTATAIADWWQSDA